MLINDILANVRNRTKYNEIKEDDIMSKVNVTFKNLESGADNLEQLNIQFKNSVTQLENIEAALNGMWDGQANDTFHDAFNRDRIQMNNFSDLIVRYVETLRQIASRYRQAEATNTDIASKRNY